MYYEDDWAPYFLKRDVVNMRLGAAWQLDELHQIFRFWGGYESCQDLDCVGALAREAFGYDDLYFVATEERMADFVDGDLSGCGFPDAVHCEGDTLIGRFDPP